MKIRRPLIELFFILFVVLFELSCSPNKKDKEQFKQQTIECYPMNNPENKNINEVKSLAIRGDTLAYIYLSHFFMPENYFEFLPYALIMANKYDYSFAYFDVFDCIWQIYDNGLDNEIYLLDSLDANTQKMAIDYLKKGVKKGNKNCMEVLGDYYIVGKYVQKDTLLGNELKSGSVP